MQVPSPTLAELARPYLSGGCFSYAASEMKRCDKIGELMEGRQVKDRREQNEVRTVDLSARLMSFAFLKFP